MKKWLTYLFLACLPYVLCEDFTFGADDITYELLTESGPNHIAYIPHFKILFNTIKIRTLLEFGQNIGTKYFLDNCNKVIGVDFISHGYGPGTFQSYLSLFAECPNWIPIAYFTGYQGSFPYWAPYKYLASEHVYKACSYQDVTHKSYTSIDDFYRYELGSFIKNLTKCHKINLAFVHPVLYLRSDLVELLFSKVDIIVAYDTHCRQVGEPADVYGYHRLQAPDNYEEIFLIGGAGTTVWVCKEEKYQNLIDTLKRYAQTL
jgi:hypothetical protein